MTTRNPKPEGPPHTSLWQRHRYGAASPPALKARPNLNPLTRTPQWAMKSKSHVTGPSLVGRVTPCAPRLQPAGAKFPRRRLPDPLPSKTLLEFSAPTSEFGFSPSPSQSESVRPLSATNPPIQRQVAPSRSGAHLSNPKTRNQAPKTLHLWLNCFVPAQEFCSAPPRFSAVNVGLQPFIFAFLVVVPNPVDRDWAMDFARQIH